MRPHHHEIEPENVLQRVPRVLETPPPPDDIAGKKEHCAQTEHVVSRVMCMWAQQN